MSIINVAGSVENTVGIVPATVLIETTDTLDQVMALGYLNGVTGFVFNNNQLALVVTTTGIVLLQVQIDGANTSLIYPVYGAPLLNSIVSAPAASQSGSLSLGSAYHNNLGYDVMLTVYLNVTAALTASVLLGVGPTNTPSQQTIISGLTLAALSIIPINIYLPAGYYALLSTTGTISVSVSGQIVMPI